MALNFGKKTRVSKKENSELFPNEMVVTLLPVDADKKRGAKKIQFNKYAIEQLDLLHIDKQTGVESNTDISFVDENIDGNTNFFMFVNTGPITIKGEVEQEINVAKSKVTKGDMSVANQPWYDAISKYYNLDGTKPGYFKLVRAPRKETSAFLYQLEQIHPAAIDALEKAGTIINANEVVDNLNHKMEELPITTH